MAPLWGFSVSSALARAALLGKHMSSKGIASAMVTSAESVIVPIARRNVRSMKAVFEGNLFKSLSSRVRYSGRVKHSVEIGTIGVFYGKNIEEGTKPGLPVTADSKLVRWARIKLKAKFPTATATRVAKSLIAKGSKSRPFLRDAWSSTKGRYTSDVIERIKKGLRSV